jgi:hypothetical protein
MLFMLSDIDITDTLGEINSIPIQPDDILDIVVERVTDTLSGDARLLRRAAYLLTL